MPKEAEVAFKGSCPSGYLNNLEIPSWGPDKGLGSCSSRQRGHSGAKV